MIENVKTIVDPEKINPVDYFNDNHAQYILTLMVSKPLGHFTSINSFSYSENKIDRKKEMIILKDNFFIALMPNALGMEIGELYSPFRMLVEFEFRNNWKRAIWFIVTDIMNNQVPYIRVGTKFFKITKKQDRNHVVRTELKLWDKSTIVDDYGGKYLNRIPDYDDFTIEPNNKTYNQVSGSNYNLYVPFEHIPAKDYTEYDIKWTTTLLKHIFGNQYEIGLMYIKVLYDLPTQKLPILVLTSEERETGKTTFLDYLELLFGANSVVINPQDISNSFNGAYASSNVIMIEESRFDSVQATEKLKNLATQKKIMVNSKFVQQYSIPFHGKLIITSNDEKRFSRVDDSEIRYWVRKVPTLKGKANHGILRDLRNEIPCFLAKLNEIPSVDTSKSRMVFEEEMLKTDALATVKLESRSGLHKELELLFEAHCMENAGTKEFRFIAKDIKDAWFRGNTKIEINYINSVLQNQMKLPRDKMCRYIPIDNDNVSKRTKSGRPYIFENTYYDVDIQEETFRAEG